MAQRRCLAEQTIVAFIQRTLSSVGTTRVVNHVACCATCRRLLHDAVQAGLDFTYAKP
jgi:hypothetical protein